MLLRTWVRTEGTQAGPDGVLRYPPPVPIIVLNGEETQTPDGSTVQTLLESLELAPAQVAVERNRAIVPRTEYGQTALTDGDALEVVTFVGGG